MTAFSHLPLILRILAAALTLGAAVMQGLVIAASLRRTHKGIRQHIETTLEFSILVYQLVLLATLAVSGFSEKAEPFSSRFDVWRYAAILLVILLAIAVAIAQKIGYTISAMLAAFLTAPSAELLLGSAFPVVLFLIEFFWLMRSIHIRLLRKRELKETSL